MKSFISLLVGMVALAVFASGARAALAINLRFADGSTTHALTAADVGHDVEIDVWATITGSKPVSSTNFDGFVYAYYSAVSSLPLGAGKGVNGAIDASANALLSPFAPNGSQLGVTQDINGDGVADVGSRTQTLDMSKPRGVLPPPSDAEVFDDTPGVIGEVVPDGYEFEVEKLFFHVNGLTSGETDFTAESEDTGALVPANWYQDAPTDVALSSGFQNGAYSGGSAVRLVAVPEPGSIAMMFVVGGFMMRRRRGSLDR